MRYKTLGFKWLFKHSTTHQVWCNWTEKYSAIPNVLYRQNVMDNFEKDLPKNQT